MSQTKQDTIALIKTEILRTRDTMVAMSTDEELMGTLAAVADACVSALKAGGKVLFCGNGGSAADAQHLAGEFVSRFNFDRAPLAGIALTVDTSVLTAIGNDYGYEHVFDRQVRGLGRAGDVLVGISTSGRSPNIVRAMETAKGMGMVTVGMTGNQRRAIEGVSTFCLRVPSGDTPKIQEGHIVLGHTLCGLVESMLFTPPAKS